jgi:endo-1,4-beta-mannosidase
MLLPDKPMPPHVKQVVSNDKIVNCGYRNPFSDPMVMDAEERLLRAVVPRLVGHSGLGLWNLGNEPDLVAHPPTADAGRAWVRRMAGVIRELDKATPGSPGTPITCGMHTPSLIMEIGFHVNEVFSEVDLAVMHGYPMYAEGWADGPLDPHFVPGLCALTSALSGKPTLAEEFGGCTEGAGNPSKVWEWTAYGEPRKQFMASEEDFAAYIAQVLPNLVEVGSQGAVLWCFADYVEELWDKPPCKESIHERFFGLVRPDGSLKPHAQVLKQFGATNPVIKTATRKISLDVPADEYYEEPIKHAWKAYQEFLGR